MSSIESGRSTCFRANRYRSDLTALLWALILACLGSCTNLPVATEDAKTPDVFDRIRALDLLPRQPLPVRSDRIAVGIDPGMPRLVHQPAGRHRGRENPRCLRSNPGARPASAPTATGQI